MEVVVGVGVLGLEGEHRGVGRRVELDHGLHRQRPVDEVRRLVIDVLHLDDHPLVVRVCKYRDFRFSIIYARIFTKRWGNLELKVFFN